MELYHKTSFETGKLFTKRYSTSFSLGILSFAPVYRDPIYAIYGFVRLADEIVDTFQGFERRTLIEEFCKDTFSALERGISTNPIIHAFILTVKKYQISYSHIHAFLDSMMMDLDKTYYDNREYDSYIFGSAEVVGLMCLKVFVDGNQNKFDELLLAAQALGSAFQKVNFLRDIKSDIDERGRIYLPGINTVDGITNETKRQLEISIEQEFALALEGIRHLPVGVKLGVYSAYRYYIALFNKIRSSKVEKLLLERVRVSNYEKCYLLFKSYIRVRALGSW